MQQVGGGVRKMVFEKLDSRPGQVNRGSAEAPGQSPRRRPSGISSLPPGSWGWSGWGIVSLEENEGKSQFLGRRAEGREGQGWAGPEQSPVGPSRDAVAP